MTLLFVWGVSLWVSVKPWETITILRKLCQSWKSSFELACCYVDYVVSTLNCTDVDCAYKNVSRSTKPCDATVFAERVESCQKVWPPTRTECWLSGDPWACPTLAPTAARRRTTWEWPARRWRLSWQVDDSAVYVGPRREKTHGCPPNPHPQPAFPRCTESAEIRMSENMLMIIVGAAAGGLLILMLVTIIVVTCHHKRKNKRLEKELTEKKYASTTFERDNMRWHNNYTIITRIKGLNRTWGVKKTPQHSAK